ncbi:MAG: nucleotidyltransferase [Methanobacterium sp.]|nr:nucleotidyltransferase [Methanobacterium sp.]
MNGIPEEKLESWASQGATVTAESTHKYVRKALDDCVELKGINSEIYLQGSYKNSTNIRGESDVDVVVQLNKTFNKDISRLTSNEQELYKSAYEPATYFLPEFKAAVIGALKNYFGDSFVSEGDKCIKVRKNSNRLDADVLVCNQYRDYTRFVSLGNEDYDEGIIFNTKIGRNIISYPKIHYNNGVDKNSLYKTNGWFKPSVRLFKNARSYLINNGVIDESLAPSFFVECLINNVPNNYFGNSYAKTYANSVNWLYKSLSNDEYKNFLCQDRKTYLFGSSPEQWERNKAHELISKLIDLWNDWR